MAALVGSPSWIKLRSLGDFTLANPLILLASSPLKISANFVPRPCRRLSITASAAQEGPVPVRFAPSSSGNLHVGGARTALFNYLFAR